MSGWMEGNGRLRLLVDEPFADILPVKQLSSLNCMPMRVCRYFARLSRKVTWLHRSEEIQLLKILLGLRGVHILKCLGDIFEASA